MSSPRPAVAEKLNRRWIACDLGRFAIHTRRKRLLGIPNVQPFVAQNLDKYERQAWQAAESDVGAPRDAPSGGAGGAVPEFVRPGTAHLDTGAVREPPLSIAEKTKETIRTNTGGVTRHYCEAARRAPACPPGARHCSVAS